LARYAGIDPNDPKLAMSDEELEKFEDRQDNVHLNDLFRRLHALENRRLMIPFKYCSRLFKEYKVIISNGQCEIRADSSLVIL
jgi:hypothetical protein